MTTGERPSHRDGGGEGEELRTCRRCRGTYVLPSQSRLFHLPACPHCGASPEALIKRLRSNRLAAVLAFCGLLMLIPALFLPLLSTTRLTQTDTYSLVGGIIELWRGGHVFIALLLGAFSVVFPIVKLALLLGATSSLLNLTFRRRVVLTSLAVMTGKYSLLDVLVVAVLIVVVKLEGVAQVEPRIGTFMFCGAILLSIAAGACVNIRRFRAYRRVGSE